MASTFTARHRSRCECGETIEAGDEVVWVEGSVEHVLCSAVATQIVPAETCGRCWLALPLSGVCGNCD